MPPLSPWLPGLPLLCSLMSPLRPLLCCSVPILFSVSPLKIKGFWEYRLFFHEKGLCFFLFALSIAFNSLKEMYRKKHVGSQSSYCNVSFWL